MQRHGFCYLKSKGYAKINAEGKNDQSVASGKIDPDSGKKNVLTKNEIEVRKIDSQLRIEQYVKERKQP